jgi:hypothetical protein
MHREYLGFCAVAKNLKKKNIFLKALLISTR